MCKYIEYIYIYIVYIHADAHMGKTDIHMKVLVLLFQTGGIAVLPPERS
jgi:hypothetical protein